MSAQKFLKNIWEKAGPVLKGIAPMAAGALAGPYGPLVATMIKAALGKQDASDKEVADLIASADPETLLKLRTLDAELEIKREELGIQREQMYLADIQSARQRHMKVMDIHPAVLTYLAIVLMIAAVAVVSIWSSSLDTFAKEIISVVVGTLIANSQKGYNFFLGSSRGSFDKSQQLEEMTRRLSEREPA
jgi:hypothetical protein